MKYRSEMPHPKYFGIAVIAGIFLLNFGNVLSAPFGEIRMSQDSFKEIEKKRLETERKLREKERIEKESKEAAEENKISQESSDFKFRISEVIIQNNELLSALPHTRPL